MLPSYPSMPMPGFLLRTLTASIAVLLLGCASPLANDPGGTAEFSIDLFPHKDSFARDEQATLRLENRSSEDLGHGACALFLERRTGPEWVLVDPAPQVCIAILYIVPPGGTVDFVVDFSTFDPGTYRYRIRLLPGTSLPEITVGSPEFAVLP
jgi:hypothetical protein